MFVINNQVSSQCDGFITAWLLASAETVYRSARLKVSELVVRDDW